MKRKKISILIPVYNEEKTIKEIIDRVIKSNTLYLSKEIIIVDDGSKDNTKAILKKLKDKRIKIFFYNKNRGKGAAIRTAIKNASGDIIIVQDADLEYNPRDFPKIISPIVKGKTNVVYGSRELSGKNVHSSIIFHIGGKVVTLATNLLFGSNLTDEATGYKVFDAKLLKSIKLKCYGFEFCPEVTAHVLRKGEKIVEVPIGYNARHRHEGKKIKAWDGIKAIATLIKVKYIGHI